MRNLSYKKSFEVYMALIVLVICVFQKFITLAIVGLAIFTIAGFLKRKIVFRLSYPVAGLAVLYLMYLVGAVFSQNQYLSGLYIENKLTFIIFPLLLSFRFREKMDLRPMVAALVLGVTVISIMGLINAYHCSNTPIPGGTFACFTASNLSYMHHPSYFSVYILMALFSTWFGYVKKWKRFNLSWIIPFSVFAIVIYGLCLSLAGWLFLFILAFFVFIIFIYRKFGKKIFWACLIVTPIVAGILFASVPQVKSQFVNSKTVFLAYAKNPEKFVRANQTSRRGDDTRVIMWTASVHEFADHIWGVGTGNVDLHLSRKLASYGQHEMAKKDEKGTILYNPHNQFLQTGLEIGIQGLAVLLLIIFTAIRFSFRHRNWILLVLVSSLVFNSLFESMLQRQSGIVFYSFWICILIVYSHSRQEGTSAGQEPIVDTDYTNS